MMTIATVTEEDIIPLAEFLQNGIPFKATTKETWLRRFEIWWNVNPAWTDRFPRGWILKNDSSIVGFIGNIPVKFRICGEEKIAVAAVTWYVDPSVRGVSSLRLFNAFQKQNYASLYLFNSDSEPLIHIVTKNKFNEYVLPRFRMKYFSLLDRTKVIFILRKFLFSESITTTAEAAAGMIRLGQLLRAYVYQKPLMQTGTEPNKEYITSLCTSCDDAFSRIWEPHLDACDIALSRDTKTLNWIYFSSIEPNERVVIQCRRSHDNSLAGYMVFDIMRKTASDVGMMHLMDMCLADGDPHILTSLVSYAGKIGKERKVALLTIWADSQKTEDYCLDTFTLSMASVHHNYIKIAEIPGEHTDSLTLCPSLIAPPRGIDHFL
jgi:hypothetical protein